MKIMKKKSGWFVLYGIFITLVFLYVLFPSDIAKAALEQTVRSSGFVLRSESFAPSLPFGFKMKKIIFGSDVPAATFFQGDSLDLQFNPLTFFQKNKFLRVNGKAYGGNFSGRLGFRSFSAMYPPTAVTLKFENIDLKKYAFIRTLTGKEITGKTTGNWVFATSTPAGSSGRLILVITGGSFALAEPFLGLTRIDFDRGDLQAKIENGMMTVEKLQISGAQLDCSLSGDITLADDFRNSRIQLKGDLAISDKKVKMNITVSGTIGKPEMRYM